MDDFKRFVAQRFTDQDRLNEANRVADTRLLDERFKTQTENISKAFDASEKARAEALLTSQDQLARQESRLKELEDKVGAGTAEDGGRKSLRTDMQNYVMLLLIFVGLVANVLIAVFLH